MTCRQTVLYTPLSEMRMKQVQDNLTTFTAAQQIPERPSIRDYKNLKKGFKTRVKIWIKQLSALPNF